MGRVTGKSRARRDKTAELYWKSKKYVVDRKMLNGQPGVIRLPDGTLIDRTRVMVFDEQGEPLRVVGREPAHGGIDEIGPLPVLQVVDAQAVSD